MPLAFPGGVKRGKGRPPKVPPQESSMLIDPASMSGDRLLGRPVEYFTPEERLYAQERLDDLQRANGNDKRVTRIIESAVMLDIEVMRCEAKIAHVERLPVNNETIENIGRLQQQRNRALKEHIERLDELGALPRNRKAELTPRDETMAQLHRDYLAEIDKRRKANHPIGTISQAARTLARSENLNPDDYGSKQALHDLDRKELLSKSDMENLVDAITGTEGVAPETAEGEVQ